jgi:hypothetical protein
VAHVAGFCGCRSGETPSCCSSAFLRLVWLVYTKCGYSCQCLLMLQLLCWSAAVSPWLLSGTPGLYQAFWCPRTWKSHVSVCPVNCARRNTPTAMAVAIAAAGMLSLIGDWFGGWSGVSQEAISNAGFKSAREVPSEVLSARVFFGANGAWSKYLGVLGESPVMTGRAVLPCWSRSVGPCGATRLLLRPGAL